VHNSINSSRKLGINMVKFMGKYDIRELVLATHRKSWLTHDTSSRRTAKMEIPVLMEL
jgi:hypothetical protein